MRADPSAPAGLRRLREAALWVLARVQGRIFGEEDADAGRRGAVRLQARSRRDRGADGLEARAIRSDLARGLSPEQIAVDGSEPGEPGSTIYRWIDAGYGGISNMDLRRKVGYKLRKRFKPRREPRDPLHPWGAFCTLAEEQCASLQGMDTVQGLASNSQRRLALRRRPTRLQLALLAASGECASVPSALSPLGSALSAGWLRRFFGPVLMGNGLEFSDAGAFACVLGELSGETRPCFCQPMRSDQKGTCERNHVLPKGAVVGCDQLVPAGCRVLMPQVDSEPKSSLAGLTPHHHVPGCLRCRRRRSARRPGGRATPLREARPDAGGDRRGQGASRRAPLAGWAEANETRSESAATGLGTGRRGLMAHASRTRRHAANVQEKLGGRRRRELLSRSISCGNVSMSAGVALSIKLNPTVPTDVSAGTESQ